MPLGIALIIAAICVVVGLMNKELVGLAIGGGIVLFFGGIRFVIAMLRAG